MSVSVCVCVCCRSLLLLGFHEMGCQEGDAGFKTMGDNDFNFMCDVGLTMQRAPLKGIVIFMCSLLIICSKRGYFL